MDYIADHYLDLVNVKKVYPTPRGEFVVLEEFNLTIKEGEFVCLIGHSGCGKSTILSMVAGLNDITDGNIVLDGRELDGPGPDRGVVFQAPSLLPWMSAYANVMLGVKQVYPTSSKKERDELVRYYLTMVGLGKAMDKMPAELSGGMRQRVGIARAFALQPKMLLLDEPFGMLDSLTRFELQDVLVDLLGRRAMTTMMVTHDVDEALFLADRIVMMTNGPRASVGDILINTLPRPRVREAIMDHPDYYTFREHLIGFLESQDRRHHAPAESATDDDDSDVAGGTPSTDPLARGANQGQVEPHEAKDAVSSVA